MTNGPIRSLKFYCPTHRIRFQAPGQSVIPCEQGGHTVGSGFPASSWWEFCCDCETFWPAEPANGSLQRTECLVCERPVARRYLCAACQVVSIESSALVRRKTYSINSESGIAPDCPGCSTTPTGQLQEHECAEANVRLLTSRNACPFCQSNLGAKEFSKPAPAAPPRAAICPLCGTRQKPGSLFCGRCGKPLPEAVTPAKAREETARRKAEETAARQKTAEARRLATAEALRVAEEHRRQEQETKRRADEERIARTARETAARQTSTLAAAIEAGKKAYQEEKRKTQLAAEARRREEEEQQRRARELERRAEEETARRNAAAEAQRSAEITRQAEAARALAEQERQRVEQVPRQQAEHERLVTELHQRAKEEEARRAIEAATMQAHPQSLTMEAAVEPETEVKGEAEPVKALGEDPVQSDELPPASDSECPAAEVAPELAAQQLLQQTFEPDPVSRSTIDEPKSSHDEDSLGSSDIKSASEVVKVPEYVPSWDQPSPFEVPQPRRIPQVWLVGLLGVLVIGVMLTVIAMKQRRNTDDNASVRPSPTATGPVVPVGMVRIPGGEFSLGSDRSNADQQEKPAHQVTLAPFFIDTTEVTCEDYQRFVKATGHKAPAKWRQGSCSSDEMRKPVTGVDWYDAGAYAKWANKRLPTEEEWEFAARGTTGWIYPWGDEWRAGAANADKAAPGIVDVATFKGASPFLCYDMVGNAWEWTASNLVAYPGGKLGQQATDDLRVIRGGSWQSDRDSATTTYRFGWRASGGNDYNNTSFRCAREAPQQEPAPVENR